MDTVSHAGFLGLSIQDKPHRRAQDKKRNELGKSAGALCGAGGNLV